MSLPSVVIRFLWDEIKAHSRGRLNQGSPEDVKQLLQEYRDSLGLGKNATFNADVFNKLVEARKSDFSGFFKGTKDPKDDKAPPKLTTEEDSVKTKLTADNPDTKIVKDAIAASLNTSVEFTQAQKNYSDSIAAFKKLVSVIPTGHKAGDIIGALTEIREESTNGIREQQKLEKAQLTEQLASQKVTQALETTFGNAAEAEKAKKTILADLEAGHKKQLADFDKSMQDSFSELHVAASNEIDRIAYLANLYKNNPKMRKPIENLVADAKEGVIEFGLDKDRAFLANIDPKDIQKIITNSGSEIKQQKKKDEKGNEVITYTIEMPRNIFGIPYYLDPREKPLDDMKNIAQAIKGTGHTTIKMSVSFDDEELAGIRGREAFEACILAGFELKNITINVNGKELKGDKIREELFKNDQGKYSALKAQSEGIRSGFEEVKKTVKKELETQTVEGTKAFKKALEDGKPKPDEVKPIPPVADDEEHRTGLTH